VEVRVSQPEVPVPHGRTLRVVSERLSAPKAERVRPTPSITRFASHAAPHREVATTDAVASAPTALLTEVGGPSSAVALQRPAAGLPVLAPRRPRRRVSELVRRVFTRPAAGRHRPETTTTGGWSMFAPQRRPRRRWGRR
jgi:hypothetical protein